MKRPNVALWDKNYRSEMSAWVEWHVKNTTIDNLEEFMRGFMQFSRGQVNPQLIKDAWNESKRGNEGTREVVEGSLQGNPEGNQRTQANHVV